MHAFSPSHATRASPLPEGALGRGQKTLVEERISARHAHEAPSGRVSSLRSANIAPSPAPAKRVRESACWTVGSSKWLYTYRLSVLQSPIKIICFFHILYHTTFPRKNQVQIRNSQKFQISHAEKEKTPPKSSEFTSCSMPVENGFNIFAGQGGIMKESFCPKGVTPCKAFPSSICPP